MVEAALRAPDHGGLVPFRFCRIRQETRPAFAALLESAAQAAGKSAESARLDRERALRAPVTVAVVARIDMGHPLAPSHEQWIAVGGAISNFLTAAHALGYAGKLLSGAKVRSSIVTQAFCAPGETLVGWIDLGTPTRPAAARQDKLGAAQVLRDWQSPAFEPDPTSSPELAPAAQHSVAPALEAQASGGSNMAMQSSSTGPASDERQ
jgi:nitroreductase